MTRADVRDYFAEQGGFYATEFLECLAKMVEADLQEDERSQLWAIEPDALAEMVLATDEQVVDAFLRTDFQADSGARA